MGYSPSSRIVPPLINFISFGGRCCLLSLASALASASSSTLFPVFLDLFPLVAFTSTSIMGFMILISQPLLGFESSEWLRYVSGPSLGCSLVSLPQVLLRRTPGEQTRDSSTGALQPRLGASRVLLFEGLQVSPNSGPWCRH